MSAPTLDEMIACAKRLIDWMHSINALCQAAEVADREIACMEAIVRELEAKKRALEALDKVEERCGG